MIDKFDKPSMGGGAPAPLPSGGVQGSQQGGSRALQQNAQRMVPNPGQFNGNPRGVYNTNFQGNGQAPSYLQQTNLGRYTPPTMSNGGRFGYNSNTWNNQGGYDYNLPGSYGSPQGGGQFAPMPGQFGNYMQPNQLSGNTFGYGNPYGQAPMGPFQGGPGGGGGSLGPLPPGKDGNPMYVGPDGPPPSFGERTGRDRRDMMTMPRGGGNRGGMGGGRAPLPEQFQPRQFQQYQPRQEDLISGSNMSGMDYLRMVNPEEYARGMQENQQGYDNQQYSDYLARNGLR